MERIIHMTVPKVTTPLQESVIAAARELHADWQVMVWRDPVAHDGYLLEHYWDRVNSGAQLADLVRLDVIYRYGGVYVDSDLKLLRALDDLVSNYDFFIASEDGSSLTNAIFGATKHHAAVLKLIQELTDNEPDWTLPPNITTGPEFYASNLKWRKDVSVLPRESFYTYNWNEQSRPSHRCAYGEHLWAHSWARGSEKNDTSPEKHSLFHIGKRKIKERARNHVARALRRLRALDTARPRALQAYSCAEEIVVKTIHGYSILADGHDLSVTPSLVFHGTYELSEETFFSNTLRGGDWVIDVGANIGTFSLLAAQCVGSFGRVFSYEPNPRPFGLLAKSLVLNWTHDRVLQRPIALGDREGTVSLSVSAVNLGGAQVQAGLSNYSAFSAVADTLGDVSSIEVRCRRLDDEFPVDLPIKILKIDVEGYEAAVLKGAQRLLERRCIDFIMLEVVKEIAGTNWTDILRAISDIVGLGYTPCTIRKDGTLQMHATVEIALRQLGNRTLVLASGTPLPKPVR
jgi:FkbM family methyltransferase